MLGVALCAVVLLLAYPTREYLAQRHEIAKLEQAQQVHRERVAELEHRRRQWEDPAYVKAQARKRLQYVMPGEVGYVVIPPTPTPAATSAPRSLTVAPRGSDATAPWYSRLWGTVQAADSAR